MISKKLPRLDLQFDIQIHYLTNRQKQSITAMYQELFTFLPAIWFDKIKHHSKN